MKAFTALLGLSFKSILLTSLNIGRGKSRSKNKKTITGAGALALISVLFIFMSSSYALGLATLFAPAGGLDIMLMVIALMGIIFSLIFIIYGAQSIVFSTKDMDILLSLPVSTFSIMLSRVLALYLEALLITELFLVPAGVVWLLYGGAGGAGFMVLLVVGGLFVALLPTLLSLVFGTLVSLLVSRMRRMKNLFNVVFSLLLIVGVLVVSGSYGALVSGGPVTDIAGIRGALTNILPPLGWLVQGAGGNLLSLLLLVAVSLVPFLLVVWLFSLFYKSLLTNLASHHLRTDYKLRSVSASGSFAALLKKEAGKFFGTPAYLLNSGVGIILVLVASVAAIIFKSRIDEVIAAMAATIGLDAIGQYLPIVLLGGILFFAAFIFTSCVSISLEGRTLWILKEAPVSTGRIFTAKAGFNFLLGAVTLIVTVPLLGYAFSVPVGTMLLMLLVGLLFTGLTSMAGLYINLLLPRMDADNDTVVIKQSASVLVTMLVDVVLLALVVLLYVAMQSLGFVVYSLVACALLAGLNALALALLNTSGRKLFAAL